jgi:hypothetical protein
LITETDTVPNTDYPEITYPNLVTNIDRDERKSKSVLWKKLGCCTA